MSAALRRAGRVASVSRLSSCFPRSIGARRSLTLASTPNRIFTTPLPTPTPRTWSPAVLGAGRQPWLRCLFSSGNSNRQGPNPPLPEGWFYPDEKQLERISKLGPEYGSHAKRIADVKDTLNKYGAPPEFKEVLDAETPALSHLPKVAKTLILIARRATQWDSLTPEQQLAERKAAGLDQEPELKPKQELSNAKKDAGAVKSEGPKKKDNNKTLKEPRAARQDKASKQDATKEDATRQEQPETNKQDEGPKQQQDGNRGAGGKGPKKADFKAGEGGGKGPWKWARRISLGEIISAVVIMLIFDALTRSDKEITWQEVRKNFLDKGLVKRFTVRRDTVEVVLHDDASSVAGAERGARYVFTIGSVESFEKQLEAAQKELGIPSSEMIPVNYANGATIFDLAIAFGPTILLIGLLAWGTRSLGSRGPGGSNIFSMNKNQAKIYSETDIKVRFADVAGMEEAKVEIMEFVAFLKEPAKFERLGAKIPRGAILSGPPGTGKTLLAKATAGESGVPFFSVSGSEFVEMFVGVGSSRVRDLFAQARKNSPCIIFIDEIDAIGRARNSKAYGGGNDERETTLNQILTEMDGFNTTEQVVVLAGTNRADILDKALLRPGRFDRHIYVDRPTSKGREAIFRVHLKRIVTQEDLDHLVGRLAHLTPGFSGADIANVVNEAALIAAREDAMSVQLMHFEKAIERVIGGLERKSLVLKPDERKIVSYHEAGHAICGWFLEHADPLLKVSIIPRGQAALGYAQYLPGDKYLMSEKQLTDRMAMMLGGRVSEELHFPTVTTGASDDFRKVTQTARQMVTQWGMSDKVGPIFFDHDPNQFQKPFAESTAQTIDNEVQRIINTAYEHCRKVLTDHKTELVKLAEELLTKEVLTRDDLVRILGKRQWGGDAEFEKYWGGSKPAAGPPPPSEQDPIPGPPPDLPDGPMPPAPALNRSDLQQW